MTSDNNAWTTSSWAIPGEALCSGVSLLATPFPSPMQLEVKATTAEDDRVVDSCRRCSAGVLIE